MLITKNIFREIKDRATNVKNRPHPEVARHADAHKHTHASQHKSEFNVVYTFATQRIEFKEINLFMGGQTTYWVLRFVVLQHSRKLGPVLCSPVFIYMPTFGRWRVSNNREQQSVSPPPTWEDQDDGHEEDSNRYRWIFAIRIHILFIFDCFHVTVIIDITVTC